MLNGEIIIATFPFSGHIFPATELATQLASRDYQITLLLPSIPSTPLHPLIRTMQCSGAPPGPPPDHAAPPPPPPPPFPHHGRPNGSPSGTEEILTRLIDDRDASLPPLLCVIVDVMASQLIGVCTRRGIPAVSFYTASACVTALEHAAIKLKKGKDFDLNGSYVVPGLPKEMALSEFNLSHSGPPMNTQPPPMSGHGAPPPPPAMSGHGAPPPPPAMGFGQTDDAVALLINTCNDLERPFLDYIAREIKKPVLGVGPLLPSQFWSFVTVGSGSGCGSSSLIRDESVRPIKDTTHSENEVLQWLDSKPPRSVIYISFGSTNTPSDPELVELAAGLDRSNQSFIWSIQRSAMKHDPSGFPMHEKEPKLFDPLGFPMREKEANLFDADEFAERIGDRGLVIRGWAPQLLILSHGSTGGFLTHCGWNSTVEALGCGVPMLTWPIHGDQIYNARLVTEWFKVGRVLKSEGQEAVERGQVVRGIEKLIADAEIRQRVEELSRNVFGGGFPPSSADAIDDFLDLVDAKRSKRKMKNQLS